MTIIRMEEMTWPQIKAAIASGFTTAVVGVGSTEQHGPHLPTMTDARIGDELAQRVALKLGNALHARTIAVGLSDHHLAFPGTLSLKPETLRMILRDYVDSLVRHGFTRIVFLPSHGGNFSTVQAAIEQAREAHPGIEITGYTDLFGLTDFLNSSSAEYGVSAEASGAHAGENETSIMMALERDLVVSGELAPGYLGPTGEKEFKIILDKGMPALTSNGVLGDPRTATAERGEVYLERLAAFLAAEIERRPAPGS
jgi:creatinine amidohydrolase